MKKTDAEKTVAAVLAYPKLIDAAKSLNLSYSSLWRKMQTPEIKDALDLARRNLLADVVRDLQDGMGEAVRELRRILKAKKVSAAVKVHACRVILSAGFQGTELIEIEQRLSELEKQNKEGKTK